jgi:hypothetical protein
MTHAARFAALVVVALFLSGCIWPKETMEDVIVANKALDAQYLDGYLRNDVDTLMNSFFNSPNTIEVGSDGTLLEGYRAIKKYYEDFLADLEVEAAKILEHDYKLYAGTVIGHGKYWVKFKLKEGNEQAFTAYHVDVRQKHRGRWYYVAIIQTIVPVPVASRVSALQAESKKLN